MIESQPAGKNILLALATTVLESRAESCHLEHPVRRGSAGTKSGEDRGWSFTRKGFSSDYDDIRRTEVEDGDGGI
ncbi:hypothetical protein DACRYDRAFT_22955 [Dacryopinax primogenitus]|uniref:Uncharacterized protein n=1 Tax=Dacryopinax primogenitus (strain DJM 731) TaxID=1858805 RepID=M5FXL3_DACPD|nr:uncharacterized protein DACRYDRAFT_22955 [Dacryopinax primogenitus]EJU01214.1 hypothetical protein DACRYDRAFT_22955 [Dacryopinax primogenitus]